jgi:hypothetical protein
MNIDSVLMILQTAAAVLSSLGKILEVASDDKRVKNAAKILTDTVVLIDDIIEELKDVENPQ